MCLAYQPKAFSDIKAASRIWRDLSKDCDIDCMKLGTSWSLVYCLNGFLLLVILLNLVCVLVGAFKAVFRIIGGLCACILSGAHLTILMMTAFIRFSKKS